MAVIIVGAEAINRGLNAGHTYTLIDKNVPATGSGIITTIEIWADTEMATVIVGIFTEGDTDTFTTRDYELLGTVAAGSKQIIVLNTESEAISLDVQTDDYIGLSWDGGTIDKDNSDVGYWYLSGDHVPCTDALFSFVSSRIISLKGIGATEEGGDFEYTGSGSFTYSGTATQSHTKNYLTTASGQFVFSGSALLIVGFTYIGSGSLTYSGSAIIIIGIRYIGTGTFTYSGTANQVYSKNYLTTASGLLVFSGTAAYIRNFIYDTSGNFVFSGVGIYFTTAFITWTEEEKNEVNWTEEEKNEVNWTEEEKNEVNWTEETKI